MKNAVLILHKFPRTIHMITLALLALGVAMCAQAQTVTAVASFNGQIAGSPVAPVQATDGNFYGVAGVGGVHGDGVIYRLTPTGILGGLHSFCTQEPRCADGKDVTVSPILGSDGNLYGVTSYGGSSNTGIIYRVTLDGNFTVVYNMCPTNTCPDGTAVSWLTEGSDGNFYGATFDGGKFNAGEIFRVSPSGEFKVLYPFCSLADCADGGLAQSPPIQGIDGNFYGVASGGGSMQGGVMYKLTPSGTYSVVRNFCSYTTSDCKGAQPLSIMQDASGDFFGVTDFAGVVGAGVLFEITSTGQYKALHSFDAVEGYPVPGLTLGNDGNIYGKTVGGAGLNGGTIFNVTSAGVYTRVYAFSDDCLVGCSPYWGPLYQGTDGILYGANSYGGSSNAGTVFGLDNGLSPLVKTVPVAGKVGKRVLILGNGLTGTTSVMFNGVAAAFTVESDTYLKAKVPAGATTGTVSVVTPSGTLNSNPQFIVTK
jgi:uncharacterized repeat protein (TIGR03803 family)